jgi:2-(1,2-epoxy-1,2-dihydrophenyl)acetyl-CoA isomerase
MTPQPVTNYESLTLQVQDNIGLVTLNRPESLNALSLSMAREFLVAVRTAVAAGVRAVVITGAGRAFCAGGNLREMQEIAQQEGRPEAFFDEPLRLINDCILLIRKTPIPFVAAVNGMASGGGCNLALSCDFVLAGESAKFNQAFVRVGLTPDCGGTFILPRLVGWRRATELMMTGEVVDAKTALEMGMITRVVPDAELMPEARQLATKLSRGPTAALGRVKELLEASAIRDYPAQLDLEREAQIQSGLTKDAAEGIAAFIEKRPPNFTGE